MWRHYLPRLVCCACLLFGLNPQALADPANKDMVRVVAQTFLDSQVSRWSQWSDDAPRLPLVYQRLGQVQVSDINEIRNERGEILAYVVNLSPEGFIVTPSDTNLRPILAFSFKGEFPFKESPRNGLLRLVKWDMTAKREYLRRTGTSQDRFSETNRESWVAYLDRNERLFKSSSLSKTLFPPNPNGIIEFDTWHQGFPYNKFCPTLQPNGSNKSVVGCVATSLGQIIYNYRYPTSISFGNDDRYTSIRTFPPIPIDNGSDIWSFPDFPTLSDELSTIEFDFSDNEVAYVNFAAGVAVRMNYGSLSGAFVSSVKGALLNKFGYGSARKKGSFLPGPVWDNEIKAKVIQNMKDEQPVQLAIRGNILERIGHSVIVEGFDDEMDMFLINLGFGGIADAWYSLPDIDTTLYGGSYNFHTIHTVIYDIAPFQSWNQEGANPQNNYWTRYSGPSQQPIHQKWRVSCPTSHSFGPNIIVGTSNRVYVGVSPDGVGASDLPFLHVYDQYGSLVANPIQISSQNQKIDGMCQNEDGEVFVGTEDGELWRINPDTFSKTLIFMEPSGDSPRTLNVDGQARIYYRTFENLYCLDRSGNSVWAAPFTPTAGTSFSDSGSAVAIDEERDRIYVGYGNSSAVYLACVNRSTGSLVREVFFGSNHHFAFMDGPAVGPDGAVYFDAVLNNGGLYAFNPDDLNSTRWNVALNVSNAPSVGRDGTIYVSIEQASGGDLLRALDGNNGSELWTINLSLDDSTDRIWQQYVTGNGNVYFAVEDMGPPSTQVLYAYRDDGNSGATYLWEWDAGTSGGNWAFGSGATVYATGQTGNAHTLFALNDGEVGNPDEAGMDFLNNEAPAAASNPSPSDGATKVGESVVLSWNTSDPDNHDIKSDLYVGNARFGEGEFPPEAIGLTNSSYNLADLQSGTRYIWSVVPNDGQAPTLGPSWSFDTTLVKGDVNRNWTVTPGDAQEAFELFLNSGFDEVADVCSNHPTGDGSVTPGDAQAIFNMYLGIPNPCQ